MANALGCDWHTINDAVVANGTALIDHEGYFGTVPVLGLDEAGFWS